MNKYTNTYIQKLGEELEDQSSSKNKDKKDKSEELKNQARKALENAQKSNRFWVGKVGEEPEDPSSVEDKTKKLTTFQQIKRTIRDAVTGAAIGAGAGGLAGGMGAGALRDWMVAAKNGGTDTTFLQQLYAPQLNELEMPKARVQSVTVPAGILGGASLGALGGLLLPPLYRD